MKKIVKITSKEAIRKRRIMRKSEKLDFQKRPG